MPANVQKHKTKGRANYYKKGDNNVICDFSGFKAKSTDCKYMWNGLFVLKEFWEARQPLDYIKGIPDDQSPNVSRPGGPDVFLSPGEVTPSDL